VPKFCSAVRVLAGPRDRVGVGWRLQLLSPRHLCALLHLVVGENVLVCWVGGVEGIQGVHVAHVPPEGREIGGDVKCSKMLASNPDVLQLWHQFAIKTAHSVSSQKPTKSMFSHFPPHRTPFSLFSQVPVNPPQLGFQVCSASVILN